MRGCLFRVWEGCCCCCRWLWSCYSSSGGKCGGRLVLPLVGGRKVFLRARMCEVCTRRGAPRDRRLSCSLSKVTCKSGPEVGRVVGYEGQVAVLSHGPASNQVFRRSLVCVPRCLVKCSDRFRFHFALTRCREGCRHGRGRRK